MPSVLLAPPTIGDHPDWCDLRQCNVRRWDPLRGNQSHRGEVERVSPDFSYCIEQIPGREPTIAFTVEGRTTHLPLHVAEHHLRGGVKRLIDLVVKAQAERIAVEVGG